METGAKAVGISSANETQLLAISPKAAKQSDSRLPNFNT